MSISFADKLKLIRKVSGLNQPKFAELIGVPYGTYKKHENGGADVSATTLESVALHPDSSKYSLWLLTGNTNAAAGQISPGDPSPENAAEQTRLVKEEYETAFKSQVEETMFMFCAMEWFKMAPDVKISDVGMIMLNKLQPIIDQRESTNTKNSTQKTA